MQTSLAQSLKWVRQDEGGNDDDPVDPGGRTSRGITQHEYNAWRTAKGEAYGDVWNAADGEIDDIYRIQYWEPWCDKLPVGLDYLYFDMNVNMGSHRAAVLLQQGLGVAADGQIGLVTLGAAQKANALHVIVDVSSRKIAFYRSLRTFWKFGKGWLNRVASVEKRALLLVSQEAGV